MSIPSETELAPPVQDRFLGWVLGSELLKKTRLFKSCFTFATSVAWTRVPSKSTDSRGTAECALDTQTARNLAYELRHTRSPLPNPSPKAYAVCTTETMGLGMFAQLSLDIGDLIVVERPLMVLPTRLLNNGQGTLQAILQIVYKRMLKENQESYINLANTYNNDGTPNLSGIFLTNAFEFGDIDFDDGSHSYAGIFKEVSRINHSCRPNCAISFNPVSFSIELRATMPIAKGDQILLSYCCPTLPATERQATLSRYKFCCTCYSCKPTPLNPSNDSIRTSIPICFNNLYGFKRCDEDRIEDPETPGIWIRPSYLKYCNTISRLLHEMEAEGMQGSRTYLEVMDAYDLTCVWFMFTLHGLWNANAVKMKLNKLKLAHEGSSRAAPYDISL